MTVRVTKKQRENLKKYHISQQEKARRKRFREGDWVIYKPDEGTRIEMMIEFFVRPYGKLFDDEKVITRKIMTLGMGFKDINWGNNESTHLWVEIKLVSELNSAQQREVMTNLFSLETKSW